MRDLEKTDEAWEANDYYTWMFILITAIFALIILWVGIRSGCLVLTGIAVILALIVVFGIIGRRRSKREHWFKKRYFKKLRGFPDRTYLGNMPEHIRDLEQSSSYDLGLNQWWISIERRGFMVYTGTFFRSIKSADPDYTPPDVYYLCAMMEHPIKGKYVSIRKSLLGMDLTKKIRLFKYKLGNDAFEDKYSILARPEDADSDILTPTAMEYMLNNFLNHEFYIGNGLLIISTKASESYFYRSAKGRNTESVMDRWNDEIPDKMIDLREALLERNGNGKLIATEF